MGKVPCLQWGIRYTPEKMGRQGRGADINGKEQDEYLNKILIVEDEEAIANLIRINLQHAGYSCEVANDGNTGADMLEKNSYDLCLFDIMLPGINGYELLEYAKSLNMPKPFEIIELLARVENVLRRFHKVEQDISIGDLEINVVARTVRKGGRDINLTCKEFDLLLLFMRNPGRALYRADLHVQRLRRKAGLEQQIESVYKVGYRFRSNIL